MKIPNDPTGQPGDSGSKNRDAGILYAFMSAACFSSLGLFAESLYGTGYSVAQTLAWRFTLASIMLWSFVLVRSISADRAGRAGWLPGGRAGSRPPPDAYAKTGISRRVSDAGTLAGIPARRLVPVLLLGLVGFAPQAGLFFLGVKLLDPGIASLLLYLYPAFVVFLSAALFRTRPSPGQYAALALSLVGCGLTFFRTGAYPVWGIAVGIVVAFVYAAYLVAGEKILAGIDPVAATTVIMTVAAIVYWILVAVSGIPPRIPDSPAIWVAFIGISLVSTVFAVLALFRAMSIVGAAVTSLVSTVEPVFTVALSAILFGERFGVPQLVGGAFILSSVFLVRFSKRDRAGVALRPDRTRRG